MIGSFGARFEMFRRVGRFSICFLQDSQPPAQRVSPAALAAPTPFRKSRREKRLKSSMFRLLFENDCEKASLSYIPERFDVDLASCRDNPKVVALLRKPWSDPALVANFSRLDLASVQSSRPVRT